MVYNISRICRVCMEDGVYDILTSIFDDDYSVHISDKIMACASVKIEEGDGLPMLICNKCADKLNIAYQFKQQCEYSDLILRELLEKDNKTNVDCEINNLNDNSCVIISDEYNERPERNVFKMEPLNSDNLGAEMEVGQCDGDSQLAVTEVIDELPSLSAGSYEISIVNDVFDGHTELPYEYYEQNYLESETNQEIPDMDLNFESKPEQALKRRTRRVPKKLGDVENSVTPTRKRSAKIKCRVCAVTMSSTAMTIHMHKVHNEQAIFCKICDRQFSEKAGLAGHMKTHAKTKLTCTICEATFFSALKLYLHMQKIHHNSSGLENIERNLLEFKTKKTRARKYICACGHTVLTPAKLTSHIRAHHKGKQNISADSQFTENITMNEKTLNEKRFNCTRCPKTFHEKGSLISHEKTHDGLREHVCKTCGRGFTHCSALRMHQRIHNGELPHVCSYCHRRFRSTGDMNEHIRRAHTFERPFSCSYCDMKFVSSSDLARHTKRHKMQLTTT